MMDKSNSNYSLADFGEKDYNYINNIENKLKMETGKDLVLILWKKNK